MMDREPYGTRLGRIVAERGALCVGIDPHPALLRQWELPADASGLERFARGVVEAIGDHVAVLKPQSAFFEAYGSAGVAVLERTLVDIPATGALAVLDVKRGDVGSTMDAYAAAYLADGSPLAADAVTLSSYLGFGALQGAVDLALGTGRGVYALAFTSNPEARTVQAARTPDGRSVGQLIVDAAAAANQRAEPSKTGLGSVGIVVGATLGRSEVELSGFSGSILAPGLGAQGATPADLVDLFGLALGQVLPSVSRSVLAAGPRPQAMRSAVQAHLRAVAEAGGVG